MELGGKQNCEDQLSGTLDESFISLGVSAYEMEVVMAMPVTSDGNPMVGMDTLTKLVLGVLEFET